MNYAQPPHASIKRMSVYLRFLNSLEESGKKSVSSSEIADKLGLNAAQVRKDLTYLGELGTRGVGYSVKKLRDHIIKLLGLKTIRRIGIVGAAGHLGKALARYPGFEKRNFKVSALFDINNVGMEIPNIGVIESVEDLPRLVDEKGLEIIVLCVPVTAAKAVFENLEKCGVRAVLNFAPIKLISTDKICVQNVDFTTELETLSYKLRLAEKTGR